MNVLREARDEIEKIDGQMAALFEKRMNAVRRVASYKLEHGLQVRDRKTEAEKIARQKELIEDESLRSFYVLYLQSLMDLSCSFQESLISGRKIAYGGVEGAYAYLAARRMFPEAQLMSKPDFTEAYRSVESGESDCAVLPIENSIAGEVGAVMDLLYQGTLYINRIYDLPIRHRLLGIKGSTRDEITTVISHSQAIGQCSSYLSKRQITAETAANTSLAARKVWELQDPSVGAIASEETGQLFGLEILDSDIQNAGMNTTRFAVFSRNPNKYSEAGKHDHENFIMVFTVKNEAGALAKTLNIIGAHGYNMRNLKSRPLPSLAWNYYFFVEAEGNIHTKNGRDMLQELSALCADLKLVGTFREGT